MSGVKCKNCGSTEIEVDNTRGDSVCTNCGSVLEDNLIVSEVQFEEVGRGGAALVGQFVSADSAGGATNYGYGKFQVGAGDESRDITVKKAKKDITHLCHQIQLNQHYINTSLNFFKMALMRHLTRGRKSTHIYAACVYITCRTEGTSHLLIDISDVQQICPYELGRTYLKLTNSLCINIPSVDPCIYIMRFANRLEFGNKTHEVSNTALRIVQRMKKDCMHSGRRPTGLCGAALLIAARMHEYNRTVGDIVRIVKIHETTLRKRLVEFADTPSSSLTLDEFMAVDLEAEQDPPAFKAARKRDRERIKGIGELELTQLQRRIDLQLERDMKKINRNRMKNLFIDDFEEMEAGRFIDESNMETLQDCLSDDLESRKPNNSLIKGIKPDIISMCTPSENETQEKTGDNNSEENVYLDLEGLDDEEIDNYILTHEEAKNKNEMWLKLNAEFLEEMKLKEERLAKEREEGKPERKKRLVQKKHIGPSSTPGEAIKKMLQTKKISSKINYDILRTLTDCPKVEDTTTENVNISEEPQVDLAPKATVIESIPEGPISKRPKVEANLPEIGVPQHIQETTKIEPADLDEDEEIEEEPEPEQDPKPENEHFSLKDMLNNDDEDEYYGYEEENY